MPQEQDNLYQLWSSVSKEYELPDFETFKADMQDTSNRRGFYESVSADYELPDYDTFQKDMGFEASVADSTGGFKLAKPSAEKKKTTQEVGAGFGPLLPSTPSTGGFKLAEPTATPAKEKPAAKKPSKELDLKDFNQRQADLKAGKITRDAYAEQQKQANDDAYIRYKQDVENKNVEFYSQNADKFSEDPVYGYMEYLKVNNPSKYTEIQERKSAGRWDKGADPVVKARLEQIGAGIGITLAAGYEAVAEILGDANAEDSAKLYNEAVSFKGQTESAIIRKLSKTPAIKEYNALQNDLQNNPIDKEIREIQSSVDALMQYDAGRLQGELKEYEELQRKGAANNNRLDPKDYERYQAIRQSPIIAEYEKLMQKQQQVLATPAGKEYAAKMQQVQQMQSAPEVRNLLSVYQKVYENAAETKSQSEAYVKKFPQQAFGEAYEKTKQEKVDALYKRMNPVLKAFVDAGTTVLRVPYTLAGEMAAGGTRALAAIPEILGAEGTAIVLNDAADVISNVSEGLNANLFPQPTNLQVATYDNYIPYNGFRVYTNQRNEVIDIRDDDGYALPEDVAAGVAMRFDNEAVKPDKVNAMNYHMILPKLTQTAADLIVLSQVPVAGAEFGLGHAASMAAYGYLTNYDNAYEEIKAADPFISEEAAHLYANTKGMMMGGMLTLTPQSIFGNQGNKIWKEIGSEYTKILAGGTTSKLALTSAMAKIMSKEGAAMAGIGFAMDLGDRAVKMAANTLTDRPTQETEYKLNQAVETGVSMFVVGGIMAGFSKGWGKGLRGDALYTGLKNYERTIGEMEQMANRGDISQQDFNRATNILSQLKPIYDNLADMGKYNDAYKANLIGLYAEKLKIEEKLGKITNIEALQKGASPERDALVAQLNQIDAKIESLAVIHNPEFVVYTESAKVTEEVDVEVQVILEKLNRGEELKRSEKIKLQNQKYYLDQDGTFKLYPPSLKVEVGNQYVYDPASGKFIAVSGAVGKAKPGETVDTEEGVEVIGARVVMPEYFAQGERVTKDQLMELMKDPEFLADFQNGRKSIDVFNDLEMQSYLERYAPKEKAPIGPERQIGKQKLLTGRPPVKGLLTDVTVAGAGDTPVRPIKGGPAGKIEITDTGVYFTNVEGKSTQLPVKDKVNPSETLAELGYEAIPQPGVKPLPAPVAVELAPDNVTFTIDGNKVTWLKFNFGNFGELQTADVLTPDGRKIKIKDRDVVYDMAVLLSNNTQTKLAVPPAKLTNDINDAVENVRAGFDVGMKAIDTIFGDVDPIVEEVLSLVEMGAEVEPNEKAAAELWLEDAISRTQKIDTQNEAEKASVLEWASKILSDINQAKVGAERPVQPEPVAERAGGEPVAKGEPSAPAKQRAYEFPELPSRGKALVKRLAGAKGEAEAERIVTTIKEAYKAEKEPAAELAKIGYGKQEYEKAVSEVVEALKPTVTEVEAPAAVEVFKPERNELIGMIEDGTAKDMIRSGKLEPLEFMRMVDKFELPMPKWFEGLEETMAEEMGYRTEEEDAELLDLINKAYERTGIPLEPEVPAEYKYTTEQTKLSNEIKELKTTLAAGTFNGKKLSEKEKGFYETRIKTLESKLAESLEGGKVEKPVDIPALQYIEGNPVAGTAEVGQYRPEFMDNVIATGKETTIILSNGERIPARYALVKLGDVVPSHDPFAFIKSKGYPVDTQGRTTNDRDYEKDPAAQATTIQYGASPDNAKLLDLSKSPATGPSVITTDGFVVGGNGRVMAMNRMSAANGVRYNTDLAQQAADFGFTAVPTYNAKQPISDLPVVVRIATTEDQYSKANSAKYNAEEGKAKSEADTSLTFGANLSENARAKELVYNEIGKFDTMGEFFADNKASRFVKDLLIKNDLVAEKDINKFFDPTGKWTVTGKELFKQGVFATLFSEDIVRLTDTPGVAAFIDKISKSLPAVAENFKSPDDINLKGEIEDAIKFQMAYHASGIPDVVDFIRQMSLFDKPSLDGALMWSLIDNSTAKRNLFRQALDSYNTSLQSEGNASLFEDMVVRSKQDFFELITKNIPENEKQAIKSSLTDEGFGPQGPGTVSEAGERYGKRKGKPGLLQYTGTGRGYAETEVGRSQQGEIDRPALIKFVRNYGVRTDGYVYRDIESGWYDIASGLSMIPGNIVMYREMAKSKSGIRGNKYRFERNGVPFNPYQYLMTGDGAMEPSESYRKQKQIIEAENAGDVGFREEEKQYRQSQFNFEQNPDAKVVPIKNEAPLMYTSALEIQEKSVEKTGTELTKRLVEAKLKKPLEKFEYTVKTAKISIDKNFNIWAPKTKIKSAADVAYIARVLEDYNTEHSMAYFIDENGKGYLLHIAAGSISGVNINTAPLFDFAMSVNAKSFYLIHNHPSGNMRPSASDTTITGEVNNLADAMGISFEGHIIADWDKSQYTFLNKFGLPEYEGASYIYPDITTAPTEEMPVYHNWTDSLNNSIHKVQFSDPLQTKSYISSLLGQIKAGEAIKGGVLLLNNSNIVVGHLFLNGNDDAETIIKGISVTNARSFITYGTFDKPIRPLNTNLNQAAYLDHITVQSNNFGKYNTASLAEGELIFPPSANDIPNAQELSMPYGKNDKTEYAVQAAMLNGFVPFEDLMLYMYTEVYNGDAAKLRKNLQDIKAAYDELSLFDDFIESASSIEDVARFDVDKFLISINRPQNKTLSLRQQYNEFASWFENHPELNQYRYYYTVKIDPENNEAYFDVNGVPVKVNGKTLYYSDWVNNNRIQKEWYESQRSKVFDRPPMVWVDKDITPVPYSHVIEGQYAIGEDQALAANLILDRFIPKIGGKKPERGFLLGDGMGIGKTRIELVSANELTRAKKLPVLIITKGDNIVEQFQREAAALSLSNVLFKTEPKDVNEPKIVVGTYEDLTRGKLGNADRYAAVIFDEAHMLKNVGTARSKSAQEFLQKTDHVVFATGTPMDKPIQLAYFISYMSNLPLDEALKPLGVYMSKGKLKRRKDGPKGSLKQLFLNWRTQMIKEGAYIRREYPFYGTMGKVYIRFDPELHVSVLDQIKKTNGRNAVMAANRFQEHLKINYAFDETVKALQEGKQVVIFCMGVNETKIYPDGKKSKDSPYLLVPQFANEFSQKLKAAGIDHAQIFGGDASEKLEESRKFQRGDVKVAVATISSGGTGIDLDDQFGDAPREVIFVTLPWSGNEFDQAQYRVSRRNTKSPSRMRFLFASNSWADMHKEGLVDSKMQTVRLIQAGKDPDMIDIERWREDVDGNIIDIVEDDFNDDLENVSDPQVGQFVNAFPAEPLIEEQQTPSEIKEKFEKGDPATLEAAGALPATSEGEEVIEVTLENQMEPEATGDPTPTTFVEPPAESRKGQATSIGGARKGAPIIKRRSKLMNILFGPPKQKSLSTRVLEIYKRLGIVTTGEHHMKSRLLGFYEHLRKDVKLKVASDIFVALHEAVHFVDFEKLDGVTYKIQNSTDARLKSELEDIHDLFYPGATKSAAEETKIAEGLTMYMQMKLYAPAYVRNFSTVKKEVFSPGGKYYDPIWDKLFNEFEDLKNEIAAMSPLMQAGLRIADMETPKSKEYTLPTWNRFTKTLFKWYDESIPLSLWDDIAGVGFGTAMERTTDQGQTIQSAQNAYFFYRNRNRLASNWISRDPSLITFTAPSRPMYYDTNGQWEMSDYSMEDIIGELKKLEKNKPDMLLDEIWQGVKVRPDEALEISEAYSKYLMMRRIFMDYRKREDQELIIQKTIADGMNDYIDLLSTTDPAMHEAKLAEFNRKYVRKVKVAFEKWKKYNEIIGNDGGTYIELNEDFSPELLAWSNPAFRDLHSRPYNPNLGDITSDANATQVYTTFAKDFERADRIFDYINNRMLHMMVGTGMLSYKNANEYIQDQNQYPGYASFQRYVSNTFFDDPELQSILPPDKAGKIRSTLQRKGGRTDIVDPLLSQAVMIHEVFRKGLKNLMWLRLANFARADVQLARGLIKLQMVAKPQYNKKGEKIGMERVIAGKVDIPGQVMIYSNGIKQAYQIADQSLLNFYLALNGDMPKAVLAIQQSRLYKPFVNAANLFTMMTTQAYWNFAVQNFTVDQGSIGLNSKLGTIPFFTSAKNFLPAFGLSIGNTISTYMQALGIFQKNFPNRKPNPKQLELLIQYMSAGGSTQTYMTQMMLNEDQKLSIQELFDIKPKGLIPQAKKTVKNAPKILTWSFDLLSLPVGLTELMTRFSEYKAAMDAGLGFEARYRHAVEVMPFGKVGAHWAAKVIFPTISYMRSSFVVSAKTMEEAKDQPGKFATVWASVATAAALGLINLWEEMTDAEKSVYMQADGPTLAQYFIVPARFMGGKENTWYYFRIPEFVGAAHAFGVMYGLGLKTNKEVDQVELARAAAANLPGVINPMEWAVGDKTVAKSVGRQALRYTPTLAKPLAGLVSGKKVTTTGTVPITPRELEFYPQEYQYRIGTRGTSSVAIELSDMIGKNTGLSPVQIDYLLGEYFSRTGKSVTDIIDAKELRSIFTKKREDFALRGRWYEDFYDTLSEKRQYVTVADTDRAPRPAEGTKAYSQWEENLEVLVNDYTQYEKTGLLLGEMYKIREHAAINDQQVPLYVYDVIDSAMKSFYDKEPFNVRQEKVDAAYEAVSEAADAVGFEDWRFFKWGSLETQIQSASMKRYYNKLYKN